MHIGNVILPNKSSSDRYDVELKQDKIVSARRSSKQYSSPPSLLLPALCHPHIHLDKAFLLTSHGQLYSKDDLPDYSDLALESGEFKEALAKTGQAKARYTEDDLYLRGSQLMAESINAGVTSMRAFVEVDHVTEFKCVESAIKLQQTFGNVCHIQLCAFAQDPIMSTEHGEENRKLMEQALNKYQDFVQVLGSTPYVEENTAQGIKNIRWAINTAIEKKLHLDFHLDYNVNPESEPLIWDAIRLLKEAEWVDKAKGKTIVFGHCTRITLFSEAEMKRLASEVADLPVSFVGLPTSDLFMMGRPDENQSAPGRRERGTLQILDMIQKHNMQACIGVNNAGNAFTPWGGVDPLRLASLGVGLYQAGTAAQALLLYECVSSRAKRAIGLQAGNSRTNESDDFELRHADGGDLLMISNQEHYQTASLLTTSNERDKTPARPRLTVADVVWDPPELRLRHVVKGT